MKTLFITCLALIILVGCSKKDAVVNPVLSADPTKLVGDWVLVSPGLGYTITLSIEPMPYTQLPPKIYRVSGKGPVNTYSSTLDYAPNSTAIAQRIIKVDSVVLSSKIAETAEQAQATTTYRRLLGKAFQYQLRQNGELRLAYDVLFDTDSLPSLTFKRQ